MNLKLFDIDSESNFADSSTSSVCNSVKNQLSTSKGKVVTQNFDLVIIPTEW